MGAVLGAAVMIGIHEATIGTGTIKSFSYALLAGAISSGIALFTSSAVKSTQKISR